MRHLGSKQNKKLNFLDTDSTNVLFLWLSHSTAKLWLDSDSDVRFIDTELRPTVAVVVLLQESPRVNLNSQRFIKKVTSPSHNFCIIPFDSLGENKKRHRATHI